MDLTRDMELLSALQMIGWCLVLAWPARTFALPAYAPMTMWGWPEEGWALVFGLVAVVQSSGLALDHQRTRVVGMVLAASMYAFLGTMLLRGNPIGTGWWGNLTLCWFVLRALRRMSWR